MAARKPISKRFNRWVIGLGPFNQFLVFLVVLFGVLTAVMASIGRFERTYGIIATWFGFARPEGVAIVITKELGTHVAAHAKVDEQHVEAEQKILKKLDSVTDTLQDNAEWRVYTDIKSLRWQMLTLDDKIRRDGVNASQPDRVRRAEMEAQLKILEDKYAAIQRQKDRVPQ